MKKPSGIIIEPHPDNYNGLPFITLLQYRKEHFLTIVDDSNDVEIKALVLDLCGPTETNKNFIINNAIEWFDNYSHMPISFYFSMNGHSSVVEKIYKTFSTECTTRVIGPLPCYSMDSAPTSRKKRKKVNLNNFYIFNNVIHIKP